ncbi:MAG: prolyl oligopeptidase family serine peptidase [Planctomycetota bacterium]|nr:prolyl oligopeptidase family serine peptidase [Planctomycetota bacterium]
MKPLLPFLTLILATGVAQGQGTRSDYERSANYGKRHTGLLVRNQITPNWFGTSGDRFWYQVSTGKNSHEFILVDASSGTRHLAFDHETVAKQLTELTGAPVRGDALELKALRFSDDASTCQFQFKGKAYRLELSSGDLKVGISQNVNVETEGLTPQMRVVRSRQNGPPTQIKFTNRLDESLAIFWVKSDGGLQRYGSVAGGSEERLSTYAGHAWLLKNRGGDLIAAFVASPNRTNAIIDEDIPQPKQTQVRKRPTNDRQSPDGRWQVALDECNVTLIDRESEQTKTLTEDGTDDSSFGGRVWWAADSSAFVVMRTQRATTRQISIVNSSPGNSVHPQVLTLSYAKPGDELNQSRPVLFSAQQDWQPRMIDNSLFPNPFALNNLKWHDNSRSFSFLYNQRGHEVLRLIQVDATSATARIAIDEPSDTFICYSQKSYLRRIDERDEAIWMSERSGWNHLYLIDTNTGKVKNAITSGNWVVRGVERLDLEKRQIWLSVSGIDDGQDPYHLHLIRVNLDGTDLVRLTAGDGTHRWEDSPNGDYLIDTFSRVDLPPVCVLRSAWTGERICELERADIKELLESGWQPPERFVAKGRDGVTDIYGIIVRPTNFEPDREYPVLEAIYAGPHSAFVPKNFGLHPRLYEMAELGFIIVKMDGMGTSHRSKAFHDVCWKNLGDSGFPDRIAWIKAAAKTRPEMDLDRVGIWGGSAGGQSAMRALIAHSDFYHAAVADCGCHDNRVDKIWWNEQWMGWPIGPHYGEQSNVTQAHRLRGDLMLIWGELDRNVDPASTMQVIDALVKANKDFEQLIVPGHGHGAAGHPYAKRRQADFFVRKLWNREPRSE